MGESWGVWRPATVLWRLLPNLQDQPLCVCIHILESSRALRAGDDSPRHMTLNRNHLTISPTCLQTSCVPRHTEHALCEHFKCRAGQPLKEAQNCESRLSKCMRINQPVAPVRTHTHTHTHTRKHAGTHAHVSWTCPQKHAKRKTQAYTAQVQQTTIKCNAHLQELDKITRPCTNCTSPGLRDLRKNSTQRCTANSESVIYEDDTSVQGSKRSEVSVKFAQRSSTSTF